LKESEIGKEVLADSGFNSSLHFEGVFNAGVFRK
jgi:hypothetical protein